MAKNDLDASVACGHGRAASRSLGPGDRPGVVAEPTRAERPHLRRARVRSSVAWGRGQAAATGRGAVMVSGWRSAVTWRRLGDLVDHPSSVCSSRPPVSSSEPRGVTAANTYRLAILYTMGSARATVHLVPLRTKRRQAERRHAGPLAAKDTRARGAR